MITFPTSIYAAMRYKIGFFFQEKTLTDAVAVANPAPVMSIGARPFDAISVADTLTVSYTAPLTNAVQLTDSISLLFSGGLSLSDTIVTSDSGIILIQDYCDFSYFSADYVGIASTF